MADKTDVKLVLEIRLANMSQRSIVASRHILPKTVAAVWSRADALDHGQDRAYCSLGVFMWHKYTGITGKWGAES